MQGLEPTVSTTAKFREPNGRQVGRMGQRTELARGAAPRPLPHMLHLCRWPLGPAILWGRRGLRCLAQSAPTTSLGPAPRAPLCWGRHVRAATSWHRPGSVLHSAGPVGQS